MSKPPSKSKPRPNRPEFREWVDKEPLPEWPLMPLTHIAKGITAQDIIRADKIEPQDCSVFKEPLSYFFYGRPAYRVSGDGAVRVAAACPFCFIFDADLIKRAKAIHAFDTGAHAKRMYSYALLDEMNVGDFSLGRDEGRPNKLISKVFKSRLSYFDGDQDGWLGSDEGAEDWEFLPKSYLHLIESKGRNEPDDRICSIEVVFGDPIPLQGQLKAIVVPHTMWRTGNQADWLVDLEKRGVTILTYHFVPGRGPEYYQALLEGQVRDQYTKWGVL